jgi:outer membrane protein TolC
MKREFARTFVIIISIFYFTFLNAQELKVLDLNSCVNYALQNNPSFQAAEKELKKANADVLGSYSGILPQLDAYGNYQHAHLIQESTIPNFIKTMLGPSAPPDMPDFVSIAFGLRNTVIYGARVNQPLFQGGAGIAGIRGAKAAQKAMEKNLINQRQNLILQTVVAFYNCLLTQEMIAVQEEAIAEAKLNLDVVLKKYNVGAASGFDKMRAEVEVAILQPGIISVRNESQSAITKLRTLLGMEKDVDLKVEGEFEYIVERLDSMNLSALQKAAFLNRPELQSLKHQQTAARMGVNMAFSNFLPRINLTVDYSFMAMRNDLRLSSQDFSEGFISTVNLQIPLFHGFRNRQQYQKAKLDHRILLDMEREMQNVVAAEVEVAYNTLIEAREKYLSANETVELAREALRLANLMYEEGANTQVDVLSSRLALTEARMNFITSLYEYQLARYGLHKFTGTLEGVLDS